MINIHPTAIIESGAEIGNNVQIGAYTYIGNSVVLGDECMIMHHASIEGNTVLGSNNIVFPYAYIGGQTQDLKYAGGKTGLKIGNNNSFREYFTAHASTVAEKFTIIGNGNNFLSFSHVAHDCIVGNNIIMSSQAALGGHVIVEDFVNIGWSAGVHQFGKVGRYAMLSAQCKSVQDIPPYVIADGHPVRSRTINLVNLQRKGFTEEQIMQIKKMFKILYRSCLNRSQAVDALKAEDTIAQEFKTEMLNFIEKSERGIC